MDVRDVIWVDVGFGEHPGVVLELLPGPKARVIYGTGTKRDLPHVAVFERTREAFALGFTKTTYFYAKNVVHAETAQIRATGRKCPPELFASLKELAMT